MKRYIFHRKVHNPGVSTIYHPQYPVHNKKYLTYKEIEKHDLVSKRKKAVNGKRERERQHDYNSGSV
jgi:hypothetical protein